MGTPVSFYPNLACGKIELLGADGGMELEIPSALVDMPQVLRALLALSENGGTARLARASDFHVADVDVESGAVSYRQGDEW